MANNIEKITSIEEQIKKLKEKQKNLERQMQRNIGTEVLRFWKVSSEKEAIEWIQMLAGQVNGKETNSEKRDGHEAITR